MTISQAIRMLESLAKKTNGEVQVYFDCPKCREAFAPTKVETEVKYESRIIIPGEHA